MLQLYFDFSGYSDMAIGLGLMMGFRFMENFQTPYISGSITEFWRRWHISLSVWLRDYLYIPLGGNRISGGRTYVNLMTVMLLGGLWHGANWTFVLWGAWHGGWLALERATGMASAPKTAARIARTLLIVLIGWVAFRATHVGLAMDFYAGMLGANGWGLPIDIALQISRESLAVLLLAVMLASFEPVLTDWFGQRYHAVTPEGRVEATGTLLPALATTLIFALAVMRLAEQSFSPFLYFQF